MRTSHKAKADEVAVIVHKHFDMKGQQLSIGGTERKTRDVVSVLNAMGLPCVVYQKAEKAFSLQISEQVRIVGVPAKRGRLGDLFFNLKVFNLAQQARLRVYVGMHLAYPLCKRPCVVFNVGVWWDSPRMGHISRIVSKHIAKTVVKRANKTICVDANFINWFRATYNIRDVDTKLRLIPNYVAPEIQESSEQCDVERKNKTIIVFPRRFQYERGLYIFLEAVTNIVRDFPEVEVHMVGESHWREKEGFLQSVVPADVLERIRLYSVPLDRVGSIYRFADIVVIPTVGCEGTSYSLIEAMFFGRPIVTTYVGGISNIAIDGFNAVVVAPLADALECGIRRLLTDEQLRQRISTNACRTAQALSFERWQRDVMSVVGKVLREKTSA
ncbi:MAG: hypothetical protein DRP63_01795 [Planctomycetota bacterium]|nr:MAG: hypothetical protein DRP63_01795 [Planctomycetota bacterium]